MSQDKLTEREANIIAHQYGFAPYPGLKCERTIPVGTTRSLFFANTSNIVKVSILYDQDELDPPA